MRPWISARPLVGSVMRERILSLALIRAAQVNVISDDLIRWTVLATLPVY